MAQEPFGDAQQQPWYPQGQQAWPVGGHQEPQPQDQPQDHPQQEYWQTTSGYGQGAYGQGSPYGQDLPYPQPYGQDPQYGQTGYVQGGYVQGGYAEGQYQPYHPHPDHGQQQYAPYAVQEQPVGEGLYVPVGAEYSADGYVHIEDAEPVPVEPSTEPEPEPGTTPEAAPVAPSRAAARRGRSSKAGSPKAGSPGAGSSQAGSSFSARARAAAGAVLTGEHVPSRRTLLVRTGAGVAALGVLVAAGLMVGAEGGGSAAATSGGEPGFAVAHTKVWSAQPAASGSSGDDTLVGSWLLADAVVRADAAGVRAYDLAAGKPVWSVEPPAAGAVPCGLSAGVNQAGLGAVLFRAQADPKSPCTLVAAVDTKTGKTAWTKTVSDAKGAYGARIGVTEDKVIAVGDDRAVAWESADGKDVWQYTGQGKFCTLSGGVTGKTVLVASSCADSTPADQAVALNTADGKVSWWRGLNNRPKTVSVLSAEPSVVLTTGEKPEDDRVFAWGAGGDPAAEIPVVGDGGRLDVAHGTFSATPEVFFQNRTMVTTFVPANGGGPVAAVGYDLDTGKQRWKAPTAAKGTVRAGGGAGGLPRSRQEFFFWTAKIFAVLGVRPRARSGPPPPGPGRLTAA
ncbi:PQQ-binding-like beta-propeller repeat protein, partial [Kitasatospora sp. NPDC059800]|uniref:outer membrane protein assembly factor BamB family protein n=1 Tax=Kitasatospora sp. NPDC059800 TaxID=3346951 RepID=UPI0036657DB1